GMTDLLVLVLLAQAVGPGLIGEGSSIADGIILVGTIMLWSLALDAVAYRWPRAALLIKGRPHLLIRDGRPNLRAMRREFLSMDELMTQLRLHGIEDVGDVRRAYIEPNGEISIIRRDGAKPDAPTVPKVP